MCDDTEINKGGYYCEVYLDEDNSINIDNFVIHKEDLDCFDDRDVGVETLCKVYAKNFDDMPYLVEMSILFDKMGDVKELAHNIAEYYTWD